MLPDTSLAVALPQPVRRQSNTRRKLRRLVQLFGNKVIEIPECEFEHVNQERDWRREQQNYNKLIRHHWRRTVPDVRQMT